MVKMMVVMIVLPKQKAEDSSKLVFPNVNQRKAALLIKSWQLLSNIFCRTKASQFAQHSLGAIVSPSFYRTQAYLGSDLWVPVSLSNSKTSFADLTTRQKLQGVTICARPRGVMVSPILSKSESPGSPDSADNFEFSAERLSENAKTISLSP